MQLKPSSLFQNRMPSPLSNNDEEDVIDKKEIVVVADRNNKTQTSILSTQKIKSDDNQPPHIEKLPNVAENLDIHNFELEVKTDGEPKKQSPF